MFFNVKRYVQVNRMADSETGMTATTIYNVSDQINVAPADRTLFRVGRVRFVSLCLFLQMYFYKNTQVDITRIRYDIQAMVGVP